MQTMLEVCKKLVPNGWTFGQCQEVSRMKEAIEEAIVAAKEYIKLRKKENPCIRIHYGD